MVTKKRKEPGALSFYKVPVTIKVDGPLYASSPTTTGGIEAALKRNMPSEAQVAFRESVGEEIRPIEELAKEVKEAIPEGERVPSTVFRRDSEDRPYLHNNYLKGHLRECAETLSRTLNFWGLKDFVTRTVFVTPRRLFLEGEIKALTTYFAPDVRLSTGVTVRQATEKTEEFVESPVLTWTLYLVGDPRWNRGLLEQLLIYGSARGLGPGRGRGESQYEFELGDFEQVPRMPLSE